MDCFHRMLRFGKVGNVKNIEVQYSRRNTSAFVTYKNRDRAQRAVEKYDGNILTGNSTVKVSLYQPPHLINACRR